MPDVFTGARVPSLLFPPAVEETDDNIVTNAIDTDWRAGSPGVFVTFIAPYTGRVTVTTSARARRQSSGAEGAIISFELRETGPSGTVVLTEATTRGQIIYLPGSQNPFFGGADKTVLVGGLTAGAQYWAQLKYQLQLLSGGTDIRARRIRVEPAT